MYVLVFHLPDSDYFERLHGRAVIDVVSRDVTAAFEEVAKSLLVHHVILSPVKSPEFGLWLVPFEMGHPEIDFEAEEQQLAIAEAGRAMVRRMLQEQLGMGVAVRTEFRLAVLETELVSVDPSLMHDMLRPRLDQLPRSAFAPPKIAREQFMEILHGSRLDLHLQPIVALDGEQVVGFEALARGPVGSAVRDAGSLFGTASFYGMEEELDLACVAAALEWAPKVPKNYFLSINMSPELLSHSTLKRLIDKQPEKALERQVLELTEHLPIASSLKVHQAIAPLRGKGARLALDDAGCGFFNMEMVRALTPDIVKICITVVRRVDGNPKVGEAIREMVAKVTQTGAVALGEGVETKQQASLLREAGVSLAQGFLFARPRPAADVLGELCPSR
jgi:EAL domain-containing protein (putative c-di-GMP-specific phosphodiesterase class I)